MAHVLCCVSNGHAHGHKNVLPACLHVCMHSLRKRVIVIGARQRLVTGKCQLTRTASTSPLPAANSATIRNSSFCPPHMAGFSCTVRSQAVLCASRKWYVLASRTDCVGASARGARAHAGACTPLQDVVHGIVGARIFVRIACVDCAGF